MLRSLIILSLAGSLSLAGETEKTITFAKESEGKVPTGWTPARTGKNEGDNSIWRVVADKTAPSKSGFVLAQTAKSPKAVFNLCVFDNAKLLDLEIKVAFKAFKGDVDQGGGLVWRFRDADNYYLARMNPLENNFRLYKVKDGVRKQLQTVEDLDILANTWHTIKIVHVGKRITCYLDDVKKLEDTDDTFTVAGKIGLWTKADAQTFFDQLSYREVSGKKE